MLTLSALARGPLYVRDLFW